MAHEALKVISDKDNGREKNNGALVYNNFLKKKMKEGEQARNVRGRDRQ